MKLPTLVPPQMPSILPTRIAFVGEAPSSEELLKGRPFVGPSGRIFNSVLRSAGLNREEYLITNVFSEKLPDNDVAAWCSPLATARAGGYTDLPPIGDAGFLRPEYRWHLTRLKEELEQCQPSVIVPLGGTALWALTGMNNIGALRGTVAASTSLVPGAKLVPTYHPAFLMKQWKYYTVVVGDLQKAAKEASRGASIYLPTRELILEPTLDDVRDSVGRLLMADLLSVDIETGWGQITCIGFAPSPEWAICVPFVDLRNPDRNYWPTAEQEAAAWGYVRDVLTSPVKKLGQNFQGYDLYWLLKQPKIAVKNLTHDTRLMHHALNPELPKSLEFMQGYGTQGAWKHFGQRGKKMEKRDD